MAVRDQQLPAAPPPMSATGADSVSAAINETLPIIESPVVKGLPEAQAALTNTGSKMVTAADMYAQTDQRLGENVGKVQFLAASEPGATDQPAGAAPNLLGAETADKKPDDGKKPDKKPQPAVPSNLNQLSAMSQAVQPLTQGLQTVMSTAQQAGSGMGNAGAAPAKLADDTKKDDTTNPDDAPAAESRLVDATTKEGAASGTPGSGSAPVEPAAGARPGTTQSEIGL
ncbi:hypothetical protein AWC05_00305 [Mycobacterium florentinum]|uniref:ESX-1 secretion-associated protein EspJ n=1 Tax=Mycobacterium florentinum TaxID=292462 RepID=A0A1X1ULT6_MYCFL|nr:hypothetical protein AWC05_00305 [Mycobacterium florentinum]BBX79789.1 ESX-1 secretion-associated protein EspJ [Mycobacterium florentinum]